MKLISEVVSKILRPLQTSKEEEEEAMNTGGWKKNELDLVKDMYARAQDGAEAEKNDDRIEEKHPAKRGRKKLGFTSHGDGPFDSSVQDASLTSYGHRLSLDDSLKSPFSPSGGSYSLSTTPGGDATKKVPTLEAPLICSTKRQPKPNLKFLAYATNEEETPSGRQRRKSQCGSEHPDRSPAYSAQPLGRIRDSKSALDAKNADANMPSVLPLSDKKDKCCICSNVRTSQKRLKDCQHWCCVECADFYIDRAPKFLKGKLNVACKFEPGEKLLTYCVSIVYSF